MKIGLIVNPLSGIGGAAALKGSDGKEIVKEALRRGAKPKSNEKARRVFSILKDRGALPEIVAAPGQMGSHMLHDLEIPHQVLGEIGEETSALDTKHIAQLMKDEGIDLLVFAGGDGTARDIFDAVGEHLPAIGIPAGTKMHSAVFANTPEACAQVIEAFAKGEGFENRMQEVMDIDEEAFRQERLEAKLYGYLTVPFVQSLVQSLKSARSRSEANDVETICQFMVDSMEEDVLYFVGTGSTLRPILTLLDLPGSLLGVDAVYNGKSMGTDLTEEDLLALLDRYDRAEIIVTVIGGQGYLFGRGNQQFSPKVIRRVGKDHIRVLATKSKLLSVKGALLVDTGDHALDEELKGYVKVITDYGMYTMKKVQ